MTVPVFEHYRPTALADALTLMAEHGDAARPIAGGTDLVPQMRAGRLTPAYLVSLNRVVGMAEIEATPDGGLRLGAGVRIAAAAQHVAVRERWPGLAHACTVMATTQVRHMGTIAGNLCNGSPCADTSAPLLAADAVLELASAQGQRELALRDFHRGAKDVDLNDGELVVAIRLPAPPPRSGACYLRISARSKVDMAAAGVASRVTLNPDGSVASARLAMSAVAPTPLRCDEAEALLSGQIPNLALLAQVATACMAAARPIDDVRASAAWRRAVVGVLARRTLQSALEIAGGSQR